MRTARDIIIVVWKHPSINGVFLYVDKEFIDQVIDILPAGLAAFVQRFNRQEFYIRPITPVTCIDREDRAVLKFKAHIR